MSVTGEGEQHKARPPTHAPEEEARRGDSTDIARLVMDAARLASRARSGLPLDPEEVRQFRSSALPVVSLGLTEAGRFARKHKPTPAQRQAAKAATSRLAVAGKNRVAAPLAGVRAAASDADVAPTVDATNAAELPASASHGALSSRAWLYRRLIFSQGRAGTFSLRNGRVCFVTDEQDSVISVPLSQVRNFKFNWFTMNLTADFGPERWMVSFTGPASGSSIKDAHRVGVALQEAKSWLKALRAIQRSQPRPCLPKGSRPRRIRFPARSHPDRQPALLRPDRRKRLPARHQAERQPSYGRRRRKGHEFSI